MLSLSFPSARSLLQDLRKGLARSNKDISVTKQTGFSPFSPKLVLSDTGYSRDCQALLKHFHSFVHPQLDFRPPPPAALHRSNHDTRTTHNETLNETKEMAGPTHFSVWNVDCPWGASCFKVGKRLSQEREEIVSAKETVLSNEVRAGLLAASVNSVGAGKWWLAVSSEVELRMLGWIFKCPVGPTSWA